MYKFNKDKFFEFNLLTKPSESEIYVLKERNNIFIGSIILIIFSIVFIVIMLLIENYLVNSRMLELDTILGRQNAKISEYAEIAQIYGEVITKTKLIKNQVDQNVDLIKLIEFGDKLVSNLSNVYVRSFNRSENQNFSMTIECETIDDIKMIFNNSKNITEMRNLYMTYLTKNDILNRYVVSFSFDISYTQ
ncbi:MAG: hypothetical protein NZZ41_06290 [Candidatus Dojkabacteria bacterium]|nr:hypothetical protein [Candidatus Dojkabacteria bacterium]